MNFFRRTLSYIVLLACAHTTYAQSAAEAFISIPDSILPYTTQEMRDIVCHKYSELHNDTTGGNVTAEIETAFGSPMKVLALSSTHIEVELTRHSSIEIIVDTLGTPSIYTIRQYKAPAADTQIDQWTPDWRHIRTIDPKLKAADFLSPALSTSEREEAMRLIEFPMYEARWIEAERKIELRLSLPLLSQADKDKYAKYFIQLSRELDTQKQ